MDALTKLAFWLALGVRSAIVGKARPTDELLVARDSIYRSFRVRTRPRPTETP